uniref:Medium-chain acyl-CoA ligase ACSF2, mitochondrial n=2 Tax=Lutzomyia longipalpis TaxID=7200 RepID=A0A1B0CU07_LUTLO
MKKNSMMRLLLPTTDHQYTFEILIRATMGVKETKSVQVNGKNSENSYTGLSYFQSVGKNPLVYRTIGQQLSLSAHANPDKEAFVFVEEKKRFTYGQLLREADRLAAGFQCLGLTKGDRVALLMPNVSTWPITMFAAARAGLISISLNPTYKPHEIEECLNRVAAKVVVASESFGSKKYYDQFLEILPELGSCNSRKIQCKKLPFLSTIIIDSEKDYLGTLRLSDVLSMPTFHQINKILSEQEKISPDSGCNIQMTSGFTGSPKMVLHKHLSVLNLSFQMRKFELINTTACVPLSFCHMYALVAIIGALCNNSTVVVPNYICDSGKILNAIWKEKCEIIFGMPKLFMELVSKQREIKLDIKNLIAITGGMQCTQELLIQMKKELGLRKLQDKYEDNIGTVGCLTDHLETKVIDNEGKLVPFGTPGELCIRGYSTMMGYWGDEEQTRKVLGSDGWLKTGDYFILESNGYGKIIGRISDIITKGTEKIFPKEIESLLGTFPSIEEVYIEYQINTGVKKCVLLFAFVKGMILSLLKIYMIIVKEECLLLKLLATYE